MIPFEIYKHVNNTDVALVPVRMTHSEEFLEIYCRWVNIVNSKHIFDMGVMDKVFIKKDDLHEWRPYAIKKANELY